MPNGVIIKGIGGFYYVKTEDGLYECKARGIFRKDGITPLPGDKVLISVNDIDRKLGNIDEILPRQSQLVRPAVANINQIVIVIAIKSPSPDFALLDKLLITSEIKCLKVIICINKIDLDDKEEYIKIIKDYKTTGYKFIPLSSKMDTGFDLLKEALNGKITVFAGQSGVGKSTILNRIMDSWVMQTGDISERNDRGKHTTRHAELLELEAGGYVVDTPGFSSFELSDLQCNEIEIYFPEFTEYLNQCKFTGCSHISEPGCSIKEALENGLISVERYERYIQLYNILKSNKNYKVKK